MKYIVKFSEENIKTVEIEAESKAEALKKFENYEFEDEAEKIEDCNIVIFDVELSVSDEKRKVKLSVNDKGNLVLNGIGSVNYELWEDELILIKTEE